VARIDERVGRMIGAGLVEEARALVDRWGDAVLDAIPTVGYEQVRRHLRGELRLEEALEEIRVATRRYARRQATWFRKYGAFTPLDLLEGEPPERSAERVHALYGEALSAGSEPG
jgi:tRNA dimethylallyltransferase